MVFKNVGEEKYQEKLDKLLVQMKGKSKVSLMRNTCNLFRKRQDNSKDGKIDLRGFNEIIYIDREKQTADVGSRMTYDDFVKATLEEGYMPAIVPELKTITVGGAVTGIGVESSSFLEGLVHETLSEMDVLTADGNIVRCNENENSDLFFGFPNSYGSLGYATRLKVRIKPVKDFVRVRHIKYNDMGSFFEGIERFCSNDEFDFVDGTAFNDKEMYITVGKFFDKVSDTSDYTGMKIYYKSIKDKEVDNLKVYDYLWRWDTDWFWRSDTFGVQNPLVRSVWPKSKLGSETYHKIMRFSHKHPLLEKFTSSGESVIQDAPIPIENCSEFLEFLQSEIGIKPIWICPIKKTDSENKWPLYPLQADTFHLNFGFWGKVKTLGKNNGDNHYNRLVENKIGELGGIKSLYSSSFYTEEEFWRIYDGDAYSRLKSKYDPNGKFRGLYEKAVE